MFLTSQGHAVEPPLHAAVYDVPPYGFRNSSGVIEGVLVDWFQELALEARLSIAVELTPLARVVRSIAQGQIDLAVLIKSLHLPGNVKMLSNVGAFQLSIWALNPAPLRGAGDLAGRRLAVLKGGSAERIANDLQGVRVEAVTSVGAMVSMLRLRRVDALLLTEPALRRYLAKAEDAEFFLEAHRVLDLSAALNLYVHDRVSPVVRGRLTAAASALGASRRYEALLADCTAAQSPAASLKP